MNKILLTFCIILFVACEAENRNIKFVSSPNKQVLLQGESLKLSELLGNPSKIYYFDSLLFLDEASDDRKMVILDPIKGGIINKLIPKGRGPGEQIGTFFFTYNPTTRKIYSFDITLRKMLELDIDSVSYPFYKPLKTYDIPPLNVLRGTMINDSTFVVSGYAPDFRVASFTLSGIIKKWGVSPDSKRKINEIINEAYAGTIKATPHGDKFVITCRYADQLEIFNLKDSCQLFVKGPEVYEPSYTIKKINSYEVLAHNKDEIYGYMDACVTNDRIYALYSGRMREDQGIYCNIIRVFSWSGDYLMDYILDHGILSFALDEKNKIIYGIATEPGAEIYKFKLTTI